MQATEKKMNNKIWLSILSVGVVIALVLGIVALVNHGDTKANAIPTINQQVDNIKNTLPELEKVSTELKGYIDTLETTTEKLQSDLTATNTAIDTLETEVYGKVDAEKTATLGQLKADKAELEGKIAAANKAIEDAKTANTASEKAIADQIAALEAELEKADADNKKALEDSIAALETALTKADADNKKALQDSIAALSDAMQSNDVSLSTAIQSLNTTLSALIKTNADNIAALQTTATNLQKQITDTNTKIDNIKTELETKISESEKKVLGELNALKTSIEGQSATVNADITALKAKDAELDQKIADLKAYVDGEIKATEDWANATFATLTQYDAIQTEIAAIKQNINDINADITAIEDNVNAQVEAINKSISDLDAELAAEVKKVTDGYTAAIGTAKTELEGKIAAVEATIKTSETSMKQWVNELLADGYYTKAEIDGKITALQTKITEGDAALQTEIDNLETALSKAEADLTAAYKKTIEDAVTNGGIIDQAIAAAITAAKTELEGKITAINAEIETIKSRLDNLEGAVDELDELGSVVYVSEYADGKVLMDYTTKTATISFAVNGSVDLTKYEVHAFLSYTKDPTDRGTTASTGPVWIEIPVSSVEFNLATDQNGQAAGSRGMLKVTVSGANLSNAFWTGDVEAILYIQIQAKSGTDTHLTNPVISDTVPVIAHNYVTASATINDFENGNTYEGKVTE